MMGSATTKRRTKAQRLYEKGVKCPNLFTCLKLYYFLLLGDMKFLSISNENVGVYDV